MPFRPSLAVAAIAGAVVLAGVGGALLGRIQSIPSVPDVLRADDRPLIPVVHLDGVHNGQMTGTVQGGVRLFVGEAVVVPDDNGNFRVAAGAAFRDDVTASAPDGMLFVASKRGTKYYPVASPAAQALSPANRVYFPDAASAETAGYVRGG